MGKILGWAIPNKPLLFIDLVGGLLKCQYGFWQSLLYRRCGNNSPGSNSGSDADYVVLLRLVRLFVKNAFNSVNWGWSRDILFRLGIPCFLAQLIGDYLPERVFSYERDDRLKSASCNRSLGFWGLVEVMSRTSRRQTSNYCQEASQ